jgi:hypothetical protein
MKKLYEFDLDAFGKDLNDWMLHSVDISGVDIVYKIFTFLKECEIKDYEQLDDTRRELFLENKELKVENSRLEIMTDSLKNRLEFASDKIHELLRKNQELKEDLLDSLNNYAYLEADFKKLSEKNKQIKFEEGNFYKSNFGHKLVLIEIDYFDKGSKFYFAIIGDKSNSFWADENGFCLAKDLTIVSEWTEEDELRRRMERE